MTATEVKDAFSSADELQNTFLERQFEAHGNASLVRACVIAKYNCMTTVQSMNAYVTIVNRDFYRWLPLICTLFPSRHDIVAIIPDSEPPPSPAEYDPTRVNLLRRPMIAPYLSSGRFGNQYTGFMKLHLWNLSAYERVLYFDVDLLWRHPVDHLFQLSANFAAARDTGFEVARSDHQFNCGLMLIRPSRSVHAELLRAYDARIKSYDGSDQGFLQTFFRNRSVTRLPDQYNTLRRRERFVNVRRVVGLHFVGGDKLRGYPKFVSVYNNQLLHCKSLMNSTRGGGTVRVDGTRRGTPRRGHELHLPHARKSDLSLKRKRVH